MLPESRWKNNRKNHTSDRDLGESKLILVAVAVAVVGGSFATKLLRARGMAAKGRELQNPHFLFGKVEGEHWGSQCPFSSQSL